jgi:hypothetical protein
MTRSHSVGIIWTLITFTHIVESQLDMNAQRQSTAVRRMGSAHSSEFSQTTYKICQLNQSEFKFSRNLTIWGPLMDEKFDCSKLTKTCFITHAYSIFSARIHISSYPWLNILINTRQYLSVDTIQLYIWQEVTQLASFEHWSLSLI